MQETNNLINLGLLLTGPSGATVVMLLLTFLAHVVLGLVVAAYNPKATPNLLMLSFSIVVAFWSLAILVITIQDSYDITIFWIRASHALGIIAPWHVLAITLSLFEENIIRNRVVLFSLLISLFFVIFSFTPFLVTGIIEPYRENKIIYGFLTYPYIIFLIVMTTYAFRQLYRKMNIARSKIRVQLSYFFYGTLITASLIIVVNVLLPFLGIIYIYSIDIRLLGPAFSLIMLGATSYSIIKYRFMDIRFALRKNITSLITSILLAFFAIGVIRFIFYQDTVFSKTNSELLIAILVIIIVMILPSINKRIDSVIKRLLFRNYVDYHSKLNDSTENLKNVLERRLIFKNLLTDIVDHINLEFGLYLIARVNNKKNELGLIGSNENLSGDINIIDAIEPIVNYLVNHKTIILQTDFMKKDRKTEDQLVFEKMKELDVEIAVPVVLENNIEGILFLGAKLSGEPFYQEDVNLLSSIASQVTSTLINARLYEEILAIKQYLENILLNMGNSLIAINEEEVITVFNAEAENIFGISADKVLGQKIFLFLNKDIYVLFQKTLEKGSGINHVEIKLNLDQKTKYLTCNTAIVESPEKRNREIIIVLSDVTRIKELEHERSKSERLVSLGEVAAGIAHEIKNPLVSIKTFADLLPEKYEDDHFRHKFSSVVGQEITRINDLVSELLNFVKEPVLNYEQVDIKDLIEEVLYLLSPQMEAQQIVIKIDLSERKTPISADRSLLKQALLNICLNSVQAMPNGGTMILGALFSDTDLAIYIEDTGIGIADSIREKIFDPFVTNKADGVGLGLSICHKIISAHGGRIILKDGEGTGSRFEIVLPRS